MIYTEAERQKTNTKTEGHETLYHTQGLNRLRDTVLVSQSQSESQRHFPEKDSERQREERKKKEKMGKRTKGEKKRRKSQEGQRK